MHLRSAAGVDIARPSKPSKVIARHPFTILSVVVQITATLFNLHRLLHIVPCHQRRCCCTALYPVIAHMWLAYWRKKDHDAGYFEMGTNNMLLVVIYHWTTAAERLLRWDAVCQSLTAPASSFTYCLISGMDLRLINCRLLIVSRWHLIVFAAKTRKLTRSRWRRLQSLMCS